jgi:hypothetical protein
MSEDLADEPFDSVVDRVKETFDSAADQLKSKVEKSKATALKKINR